MGTLRDALICGYYDNSHNYIVEINTKKLQEVIDESYQEYKDFLIKMEVKVKLYELLKFEFTRNLNPVCNQFVVDFK